MSGASGVDANSLLLLSGARTDPLSLLLHLPLPYIHHDAPLTRSPPPTPQCNGCENERNTSNGKTIKTLAEAEQEGRKFVLPVGLPLPIDEIEAKDARKQETFEEAEERIIAEKKKLSKQLERLRAEHNNPTPQAPAPSAPRTSPGAHVNSYLAGSRKKAKTENERRPDAVPVIPVEEAYYSKPKPRQTGGWRDKFR